MKVPLGGFGGNQMILIPLISLWFLSIDYWFEAGDSCCIRPRIRCKSQPWNIPSLIPLNCIRPRITCNSQPSALCCRRLLHFVRNDGVGR